MPIDAVFAPRARRFEEETDPPPQASPPAAPPRPSRSQDARHDASLQAFVANTRPRNDRILYVGMNDDSKHTEAAALGPNVQAVMRSDASTVTLDRVAYDVSTLAGAHDFAAALGTKYGLAPDAVTKLSALLDATEPAARDELARIALAIAPGEKGAQIPSRLVLSGHSSGDNLYGRDHLLLASIRTLGEVLPRAAKQIEDIHFSACMTSAQVYTQQEWTAVFPNLKTMWGYSQIAPGAPVGHLQTWEVATRGRASSDPRHGIKGVTTWSERDGIRSAKTLADLRKEQIGADASYDGLLAGRYLHGPDATKAYETYRELSKHPGVPAGEQPLLKHRAEALLRLRHYPQITTHLVAEHGRTIAAAYESLGLPAPDLARLDRAQGMGVMDDLVRKAQAARPLPEAVRTVLPLLQHLRDLDAGIPEVWSR